MPQGLQVWNAAGVLILDTPMRLGRVLGTASIGNTNGSVSNALLTTGTPFWFVYSLNANAAVYQPVVSVAGSTLSWTWAASGASYNTPCALIYGVY